MSRRRMVLRRVELRRAGLSGVAPQTRTARAGEHGQALVLVAISMTALLAFGALAVDVGRFYTERRFLQNAADAAALAAANALVAGKTATEAEVAARSVLTANFRNDPTGTPPSMPSVVPLYDDGHTGEGSHLRDGILIDTTGVRVSLTNPIGYTFGRVVNNMQQDIGAHSVAGWSGGLLPVAVREFISPPGPAGRTATPCADDESQFMAVFATANTACLGTDASSASRTDPTAGSAFDRSNPGSDPAHHGPVTTILGQGSQPSNSASFRGFIALDIRNFATSTSQLYYNSVSNGSSSNSVKQVETGWITRKGYPGPNFTSVTSPPNPNDQVGILDGNSAGLAIDELAHRYAVGDEIVVAAYPGYVMAIPDFSITPPSTIALPMTGTVANAGSLKVSRNQAFSGTVDLSTVADTLDPANPMVLGSLAGVEPATYTPDPVTPSLGTGTTVSVTNMTTNNATPGIYALWATGQAGSPYLTTKSEPFSINVGGVTRDFSITADAGSKDATNAGDTVSFALSLTNSPDKNTNFGGTVTVTVDAPLPVGVGAVSLSSATVTPSKSGSATTLTINTGTLSPGEYRFVVRAKGLNGDSPQRSVTHLLPLVVNVAPSSAAGNDAYLDISGFALMRIAEMASNYVTAYAITPVVPNLDDPLLRQGQTARLMPW